MRVVVIAMELLGVLLLAAAAGLAAASYLPTWAGLFAASVVVLAAAALADRQMTPIGGDRGATVRTSAPGR